MNDTDRKSMDDVLASIRRIVRAEKEGAVASVSGEGPHEDIGAASDGEEPLVLTPEMRTDAGAGAAGTGAPTAERAADMSEATYMPGAAPEEAVHDREALRAMLRELLREELSGGAAEESVRGILRDELTSGEIGSNISQNVLRMIRAEVAKALRAPH
jgi:hypothetical protein